MGSDFRTNEVRHRETGRAREAAAAGSYPTFNELLMEDAQRKADPKSWNPFMLPGVEIVDSRRNSPQEAAGEAAKPKEAAGRAKSSRKS